MRLLPQIVVARLRCGFYLGDTDLEARDELVAHLGRAGVRGAVRADGDRDAHGGALRRGRGRALPRFRPFSCGPVGRVERSRSGATWMVLWCFACRRKTTHYEMEKGWRCEELWCGEEMRMR
jgi:hypothetical protein